MSADQLTILSSRWRRLAKTITRDGEIIPYDHARIFDFFELPVSNLTDIGGWLNWLLDRQDCCVVRAGILDRARIQGVRRLLFPDSKTGDQATLRDVARQWVALDFDDLPARANVQLGDLPSCAAVAIERLPSVFCGAACIVQATASHGIKPGLRLRLVVLSDLLDEISEAVSRHVVLPNHAADVIALWVAHTWVYEKFEHSPRLGITSRCALREIDSS